MSATTSRVRRYSVKHAEGWCAVERGHKPVEGEWNTPTACGMYVTAPFDFAIGLYPVDCSVCLAARSSAGEDNQR